MYFYMLAYITNYHKVLMGSKGVTKEKALI